MAKFDELEDLVIPVPEPTPVPQAEPTPAAEPTPTPEAEPAPTPAPEAEPTPEPAPEAAKKDVSALFTAAEPTPVPAFELPADIKQRLEEAEKKAAEHEQFKQLLSTNPFYKALELGVTPEGLKKVVTEMAPDNYANYTYEQLLAIEIRGDLGLEGQDLADAINEHLEAHKLKTKIEQAREEKALKGKFVSDLKASPTLDAYEKIWKENQANQVKPPTQEDLKKIAEADVTIIKNLLTPAIGGVLDGIEVTEERVKGVLNAYNPNSILPYVKPDSTIDEKLFSLREFRLQNFDAIIAAARQEAKLEVLRANANIGKPLPGNPPAGLGISKTQDELLREGFEEM